MGGNSARALLPALVVLVLVGVVAVAATGSTSGGSGETRRADLLLDTIISLSVVALLPAVVVLVYGLMQRKAIADEMASGRYRRFGFVSFATVMLLFLIVTYFRLRNWERPLPEELAELAVPGLNVAPATPTGALAESAYQPQFAWIPVLVVVGLAAAGAFAYYLAARRRANSSGVDTDVAEALAVVFDDTLDDLRAESDPRRAVIAAYARLERVLAAHGIARRAAETPEEYLARILAALAIDPKAVRRLTDLFSRAKFSQHAVDVGMKEEAIEALEHVRDELREAAAARDQTPQAELVTTEASS